MAVETNDVVATPAEAAQLELAPLIVSDTLRAPTIGRRR